MNERPPTPDDSNATTPAETGMQSGVVKTPDQVLAEKFMQTYRDDPFVRGGRDRASGLEHGPELTIDSGVVPDSASGKTTLEPNRVESGEVAGAQEDLLPPLLRGVEESNAPESAWTPATPRDDSDRTFDGVIGNTLFGGEAGISEGEQDVGQEIELLRPALSHITYVAPVASFAEAQRRRGVSLRWGNARPPGIIASSGGQQGFYSDLAEMFPTEPEVAGSVEEVSPRIVSEDREVVAGDAIEEVVEPLPSSRQAPRIDLNQFLEGLDGLTDEVDESDFPARPDETVRLKQFIARLGLFRRTHFGDDLDGYLEFANEASLAYEEMYLPNEGLDS